MAKYSTGSFRFKNPEKYVGKGNAIWRSSWEFSFMQMCDNHPAILQWASESIHIPYRNPFTGKNTIYIPDFLIVYHDAAGQHHVEVIEIKPLKETSLEQAKSQRDKAYAILNMAKWEAARTFCRAHNMQFRIVTETDIFKMSKK